MPLSGQSFPFYAMIRHFSTPASPQPYLWFAFCSRDPRVRFPAKTTVKIRGVGAWEREMKANSLLKKSVGGDSCRRRCPPRNRRPAFSGAFWHSPGRSACTRGSACRKARKARRGSIQRVLVEATFCVAPVGRQRQHAAAQPLLVRGKQLHELSRVRLRTGEEISVAFRSAKAAFFRGAKGDIPTVIDSPVLTDRRRDRWAEGSAVHARKAAGRRRILRPAVDDHENRSPLHFGEGRRRFSTA